MTGYNPYSLEGKTILVTGAAGGIGRATSVECARLGAKLILTDINEDGLKTTLEGLEGEGHSFLVADMTSQEALDEMVSSLPMLDGMVSNAGVTKPSPVKFIKKDDIERIMQINTFAPICLTQKLIKKKKINVGGSLVFTVSIGGVNTGLVKNGTYSDEDKQRDMETYPLKRYGEPRDIALAITFLLSDASSWITGHSLIIDGGKTLY